MANVPEALSLAATTAAATVVAIAGVAATTGPVDLAPIPVTFGVRAAGVVFLGLVAVGAAVALRALRNAVVDQLNRDADRIAELQGLGRLGDWPVPGRRDHEAHLRQLIDSLEDDR